VNKRHGITGGLLGVVGVAAATGVVIADRRLTKQRKALAAANPHAFDELPMDRSGWVAAEDGTALYYEEVGPAAAALTVVFVHGFALRLGAFHYQRQALCERFGDRVRMVFYDQRGHGRSARTDAHRATIDQLGRDLFTVLENLVADGPIVLVGHSMGGMTIMALADARPELFTLSRREPPRIAGVALLSTSTGKLAAVTLGLPALLARLRGPLLPLLLRGARRQANLVERGRAVGTDLAWMIIRRMSFGSPDVDPAAVEYLSSIIAGTRIDVIADFYPALMSHDKLAALDQLRDLPVLIMCGEQDLLTPVEHSQAMADALPNAQIVVVPQGGHVAVMEQPQAFTQALEGLIDTALQATAKRRRWSA
jgi:pimeloyl-ACP methyl ester carboxylesterase